MMTLTLTRKYTSHNTTLSDLVITDSEGKEIFCCEALELGFHPHSLDQYVPEKKLRPKGTSGKCLPTGRYLLKPAFAPFNPSCLKVHHATTHNGTLIYGDTTTKRKVNAVLLGRTSHNGLWEVEEARDEFNEVVMRNFFEEWEMAVKEAPSNSPRGEDAMRSEG